MTIVFNKRVDAAMRDASICRGMPYDMSVDYFFAPYNQDNKENIDPTPTKPQLKPILKNSNQSGGDDTQEGTSITFGDEKLQEIFVSIVKEEEEVKDKETIDLECDEVLSEASSEDSLPLITQPEKLPLVRLALPINRVSGKRPKYPHLAHPSTPPPAKKSLYLSSDSDSDSDMDKEVFELAKVSDYCSLTPVKSETNVLATPAPLRGKKLPLKGKQPSSDYDDEIQGGMELHFLLC